MRPHRLGAVAAMACRRSTRPPSPRRSTPCVIHESLASRREPRRFRDGVRARRAATLSSCAASASRFILTRLVDIIDGALHYWSELKTKTLKLLPKWIIGSSAEQAADKGEEKTAKEISGSGRGGRRDRRAHLGCFWRL